MKTINIKQAANEDALAFEKRVDSLLKSKMYRTEDGESWVIIDAHEVHDGGGRLIKVGLDLV